MKRSGIAPQSAPRCDSASLHRTLRDLSTYSLQLQHHDAPLRQIEVHSAVALGLEFVVGVARAVPAAEVGVLGAEDLFPVAGLLVGGDAIAVPFEIILAEVHDREDEILARPAFEREHLILVVFVGDDQRVAPQCRVFPAEVIHGGDEPPHFDTDRVAGDRPIEAVVAVVVFAVVPVAPADGR